MFFLPSPPVCRKRKSNLNAPLSSNKRVRLVGIFEPRCIVPTGARRSWTYAKEPRFILDPVTQGTKRSLQDEELPISSNCKVRILDNRDVLFLPSHKRLCSPKKPQRKRTPSSSPAKKSVEFVRLRRREFIRRRQLQRVDSGICMDSDEDLNLNNLFEPMVSGDFKFFDGVDVSTLTGFSVEMMEATEAATEDDMEIEDVSTSTTTTAASTTEGDADSAAAEQATSSKDEDKKEELEKDMSVDKKEDEEEKGSSSDVEVEDAEKKDSEEKEANTKPSSKDTAVKERIRKRLGDDELVRLGPSASKKGETKAEEEEDEDEDEEPPRRSRRKSSKLSLPTTVEEEEEDEREREDDDDVVVVIKRKSSRKNKEEEKDKKEKGDESEKETEKKGEKKEKKKLIRRKAKAEESGSESDGSERDEKKPKKRVVKEEEKIEVDEEPTGDKMEEDTDEDSNSSGEDTDMSTDEDIADAIAEDIAVIEETIEEDVTMSEDDEMAEESPEEVSEEKKDTKEEVNAETTAKDTETKDVEVTTSEGTESRDEDQEKQLQAAAATASVEVKKSVRRLVLAPSKQDEFEAAKMLSVPRTPRTPRSPNMSRFNITMSKAPRKLNPLINPLLSPRRGKFNKSEDLSAHWTMKRLAAKKRQQPFNPANISRHAYRDPINEDELYNLAARKALWEDDEAEEAYADEFLRVEWTCTTKSWDGRYGWMVENGSALMEFCVRKLEGFNMGW